MIENQNCSKDSIRIVLEQSRSKLIILNYQ